MSVQMYGPAFDDSGQLVERQVPDVDVKAYEAAGYIKGSLPPDLEIRTEQVAQVEQVTTVAPEPPRRRGRPPRQAESKEDADNHTQPNI